MDALTSALIVDHILQLIHSSIHLLRALPKTPEPEPNQQEPTEDHFKEIEGLIEVLFQSKDLWTSIGPESIFAGTENRGTDYTIVQLQEFVNQEYMLCEALRSGTTLSKRFASALESGTLGGDVVAFQGELQRSIGIVVAEQIKVLENLVGVCKKYVSFLYFLNL